MSEKAKDPEVIAKKISHKPIDYEILNRLTDNFGKRFTSQQELSAEQAFWLRISNPTTQPSLRPVRVEVPSELPKVSLVNEILKKIKFQLAQFDSVVKKRTTPNALTEGELGFEHTKAVVNNEIILFLKSLKNIFNVFDKDILNEITEVKIVFDQMEVVVQQSSVDKQCLKIANKELLLENDRLSQQIMSQDIVSTLMNWAKLLSENERLCKEINHVKQVLKDHFDSIKQTRVLQKEQCDSLINKLNLKSAEHKYLKAQIQDKVFVITSLKNDLRKLKGKATFDNAAQIPSATTVVPKMFKLDLEPLAPKLMHNREIHILYLKHTKDQADILRGIVEQAKSKQPLNNKLDFSCKHAKRIQKLLVYVQDTCPSAIRLSETKVVQIVLWYLDSECSKHMIGNRSQLMNFVSKFLGAVRFENDQIARIIGYGDYLLGNVIISRTLREFYENVGISYQTSVARTPQQNGVVERRKRTLVEAARTMLIFSKALLFLWVEAINTACYTQNRSLIRHRYNKTPYELMQHKKLDLSFLHVFGSLCYPINDHKDLGKFDAKANIRIFVGYAPAKKAFRIYNRRTRIM
uniref:Retrovirus-related Pol polyprotein from transposon TNT 1-94 n=1 Tax=Tanacetum cinerariifolium TaxID=118510 RepID=A0A6L2M029_TANCI|nr:retrovirus-related Pol polyprotein from transposon TNT 1-94 [Tanacetum cinerariifolium]